MDPVTLAQGIVTIAIEVEVVEFLRPDSDPTIETCSGTIGTGNIPGHEDFQAR